MTAAVPMAGHARAGAEGALRAGFQVQTLPQGVTDPNQVGIVVDEQPLGAGVCPPA